VTDRLRRYRETRGSAVDPLPELTRHLEEHGPPGPAEIRDLAARLALPPAAVRGALSFFADLHREPHPGSGAPRFCRGTSCWLAREGGPGGPPAEGEGVYCLGFCDRSPARLLPDGGVELGGAADGAAQDLSGPPAMRSLTAEPLVLRNALRGDASGLEDARAAGVYGSLERALAAGPEAVLDAMERSGERGRGGAAFPAGLKWRRCAQAPGGPKHVVANGDEGDPGSFVDRVLMERDPHSILEGMILCGWAVGAASGIVFIRSEYPAALARMRRAIGEARAAGLLGPSVLGSGFAFDVAVFPGMGSYVCGEETAMLNAIEGLRGEVRLRPPFPVDSGLWGRPTVVNNVETLVNVPWIVARGAEAYRALGTDASSGTKVLCLSRGFARPGLVEVEFGVSLRQVIEEAGGGGRDGAALEAVLLGGPMGSLVSPADWDVPVCYTAMAERGLQLGHGGLVAIPRGTDPARLLVHLLEFMAEESCGKCVPCRVGSRRGLEMARDLLDGGGAGGPELLDHLLEVVSEASLCAFGRLTPGPVRALLRRLEGGTG
jgi:NADH:ubiquinone oxidoreductase subunit F (NADH-binding)